MMQLHEARGLLARAVMTQGPEFVYNREGDCSIACVNVPIGMAHEAGLGFSSSHRIFSAAADDPRRVTGCLVGTALLLSGRVTAGDLAARADNGVATFSFLLTDAALAYLETAQDRQDAGASWGGAYAAAEDLVLDGIL